MFTILIIAGFAALLMLILIPVLRADRTPTKTHPRIYTGNLQLCPRCNMFHRDHCPSGTTYRYQGEDR